MLGAFFGFKSNKRAETKEVKEDNKLLTEISIKLDYAQTSINSINSQLNTLDAHYVELRERLAITENSTKQAHHRIEDVTKQIAELNKTVHNIKICNDCNNYHAE